MSDDVIVFALEAMRASGKAFWLTVNGTSMHPFLRDGDQVLVRFDPPKVRVGDLAIFQLRGKVFVHRIHTIGKGLIRTYGDNHLDSDPPIQYADLYGIAVSLRRADQVVDLRSRGVCLWGVVIVWGGAATRPLLRALRGVKHTLVGVRPSRVATMVRWYYQKVLDFILR